MLLDLENIEYFSRGHLFPWRSIPLYSMLSTCGYSREDSPEYRWHGLRRGNREFMIWQYTVRGLGAVEYEGETYDVPPDSAMLLHVPQDHCYYLPSNSESWDFVYLNFTGQELFRLWRELEKSKGPVISFTKGSRTPAVASKIVKSFYKNELKSPFQGSSLAYQMIMAMYEDLWPKNPLMSKGPDFIKPVLDFCMERLADPLTVEDMARAAGYSRYHFTRVFSSTMKMSPAAFLKDVRLKQAIRQLQMERMSVKEIATACGFNDASYFCKVFRKKYDLSPGEFRDIEIKRKKEHHEP